MVTNIFFYQADSKAAHAASQYMEQMGLVVASFSSVTYNDALLALESEFFDLCIVDLSIDADNRFSLVDKAREMDATVPVIFLHGDVSREILLEGYNKHSIDFDISRPYDFEVFVAQVNALVKRSTVERMSVETIYSVGKYKVDIPGKKIILGDSLLKITDREAFIINYLCSYMNRSFMSKDLQKEIWGEATFATANNLKCYLVSIRRYFEADPRIKIESKRPGEIGLFFES